MNAPACRHLVAATLVFGLWLAAPVRVHADCGGNGTDNSSGADTSNWDTFNPGSSDVYDNGFSTDISAFTDMSDSNWDNTMTEWNFFAQSDPNPTITGDGVFVSVNANPNVYAGSPTPVASTAAYINGIIIAHQIEYINADGSSGGAWTNDYAYPGASPSNRTINITYPTPGTYYVKASASVLLWNGQNPWIDSDTLTVTVNDPITNYTVAIQTHPKPGMEKWVLPSNVVSKNFQVFHSN
jgi:hypothetical protein